MDGQELSKACFLSRNLNILSPSVTVQPSQLHLTQHQHFLTLQHKAMTFPAGRDFTNLEICKKIPTLLVHKSPPLGFGSHRTQQIPFSSPSRQFPLLDQASGVRVSGHILRLPTHLTETKTNTNPNPNSKKKILKVFKEEQW